MIRDLAYRTSCALKIVPTDRMDPSADKLQRQIEYKGTLEQVAFAKSLVSLLACESGLDVTLPNGNITSKVLMCPQDKVGLLIGANGDVIKHIQKVAKARVQVDRADGGGTHNGTMTGQRKVSEEYKSVQHNTIQYNTIQYNTIQYITYNQ